MKSSDVRTQCSRSSNMYQACILCVCYAVIVSAFCYHMVLIVLKGNCLNLDKNVKTDPLRAVVSDASCHPVLSCQRSHKKTELLIILQNILSVETVMNGL